MEDLKEYLKNNKQQFNNPFEYKEYFVGDDGYEEYDEYIDDNLLGVRKKNFLRVDNACLQQFISELKNNKNASYITYVNDSVKEGYLLSKMSAMVKKYEYSEDVKYNDELKPEELLCREVLGSQMLNYYGVPTVFNSGVYSYKDGVRNFSLVSLDFMSEGDEFLNLRDEDVNILDWSTNFMQSLNNLRKYLNKMKGIHYLKKEKIMEDFVYSYLVRNIVLRDIDFRDRNMGIIVNNDKKTYQFINFDYEYCFEKPLIEYDTRYYNVVVHDMKFIQEAYSKVYEKFIKKTLELQNKFDELEKINYNNESHKQYVKFIRTNIESICRYEKQHESDMVQ